MLLVFFNFVYTEFWKISLTILCSLSKWSRPAHVIKYLHSIPYQLRLLPWPYTLYPSTFDIHIWHLISISHGACLTHTSHSQPHLDPALPKLPPLSEKFSQFLSKNVYIIHESSSSYNSYEYISQAADSPRWHKTIYMMATDETPSILTKILQILLGKFPGFSSHTSNS